LASQRPAGFEKRISEAIKRHACSIEHATQKASSHCYNVGALFGLNTRSSNERRCTTR
jgi:hypothetical protein